MAQGQMWIFTPRNRLRVVPPSGLRRHSCRRGRLGEPKEIGRDVHALWLRRQSLLSDQVSRSRVCERSPDTIDCLTQSTDTRQFRTSGKRATGLKRAGCVVGVGAARAGVGAGARLTLRAERAELPWLGRATELSPPDRRHMGEASDPTAATKAAGVRVPSAAKNSLLAAGAGLLPGEDSTSSSGSAESTTSGSSSGVGVASGAGVAAL